MRVPLTDFDEVEQEGDRAIVTKDGVSARVQVDGEYALLFPDRSVKHRDLAKRL
jgi:hypothetical protein